jgi:hypothetical protein
LDHPEQVHPILCHGNVRSLQNPNTKGIGVLLGLGMMWSIGSL